jgi:hypothetical protein
LPGLFPVSLAETVPAYPIMQVFGPNTPVKGMRSDTDMAHLGPGSFQLLKNFRCEDGLPEARNLDLSIRVKPSWATGAPLGAKSVSINGQQWEVAVWNDGSTARVAVMPSDLSRWVEVTGTGQWTGPSGSNRLTDADNHCQITVIRTPRRAIAETSTTVASRDVVLIQNGEDYPRIWDPGSTELTNYTVTNVAGSGGLVRLTIAGHPLNTGDHVYVTGVGGTPSADGLWQITDSGANTIDLQGSVFGTGHANGTVTDRADLLVHKPVSDISPDASSIATPDYSTKVVGSGSITYETPVGVVNSADNRFLVSSTAPYSNENVVPKWEIATTVDADDVGTFTLATTPLLIGNQIIMLVEGAQALSMISQCKWEICTNTTAYPSLLAAEKVTIFDPATRSKFQTITENSTNNRYWVIFDSQAASGSTAQKIACTWKGTAPASAVDSYILAIGSIASDLPASTVWGYHYEDELDYVEQRFHAMRADSDSIREWGGALVVRDGSSTTPSPAFPLVDTVNAHFLYRVNISTLTSSSITGGLDGVPQKVSVYAQTPGSEAYYWIINFPLYARAISGGARVWTRSQTPPVVNFDTNFVLTRQWFNYNREAPSAFQVPIPIASACEYVNQRLYVGSVKDTTSQYAYSDYYFSWDRNPFRFQQVQEDEFKGGYGQLSGERIMALRFSASGALGSGRVFMFSDQWLYSMGESGPFPDAGLPASEIGRPVRIGPHGTLSPRAPAVGYNSMVWPDQDAQIMRLGDGGLQNISRGQVEDRFRNSVTTRKANITGAFWKDRFYFGFTPSGESLNERVLVWNERMGAWESEDYETNAINFELLHVWPTTPGVIYASRLFFYDSAGTLFGYEETASGTIAVRWTTGSFNFNKWTSWYIEKAIMAATSQAATGTLSRISSKWGASEPWSTTISFNESGAVIATYLDSVAHAKIGTERTELDWEWYLDYTASVSPGTKIRRLEFEATESNVNAGLGT